MMATFFQHGLGIKVKNVVGNNYTKLGMVKYDGDNLVLVA